MIDTGMYQLISSQASVLGLTGGLWPNALPEEPILPAMTYTEVGGSSQPTFDTLGMQKERWQFDIFGAKRSDVMSVYWAFRQLLDGYQDTLPDGTYLQNAEHLQRVGYFDDASRSYRVMTEFYLYFVLPF